MWLNANPPAEEKVKAPQVKHQPESFLMGPASSFVYGNSLYHNLRDGKFEEVSDRMGAENYWPWGPSAGDLNADGWEDLFIASSMNFPYRYAINSVLLNNKGAKFLDSEFLVGVEPRRDGRTRTPWFDIDCAGPSIAQGSPSAAVCTGRKDRITVMGALGTRSAAILDLDNDGDLDIVTNDFNSEPQILISNLAEKKRIHWLKVKLTGTASNRDGLGATVRVIAARRPLFKYHDGKSGYLSQSSLPLYFGLADAQKIDRVEVDWPSGKKQVVTQNLPIDQLLQITEPK
jgi:enediyne biosynthesis protein E4